MKKSILKECLRISNAKLPHHPELGKYLHYSFIIQSCKIIEWATNATHEPPIYLGYHRYDDSTYKPKYHSECFAYKKAKGLIGDDPFDIINIRLGMDGQVKLSKPCKACYRLMKILGCEKFYYSCEIGFMELK